MQILHDHGSTVLQVYATPLPAKTTAKEPVGQKPQSQLQKKFQVTSRTTAMPISATSHIESVAPRKRRLVYDSNGVDAQKQKGQEAPIATSVQLVRASKFRATAPVEGHLQLRLWPEQHRFDLKLKHDPWIFVAYYVAKEDVLPFALCCSRFASYLREARRVLRCSVTHVTRRLPLLQWAVSEAGCPLNSKTMAVSARHGELSTVKWLHENGCPWDIRTMYEAAYSGSLSLVKWLEREGCPWNERACEVMKESSQYSE